MLVVSLNNSVSFDSKNFKTLNTVMGEGGCNLKNLKKAENSVPNLKFAVAFGFRHFSVFFGLNFDKKFQPFINHVNNEVLRSQELPNKVITHLMPIKPSKCLNKAIITDKNH